MGLFEKKLIKDRPLTGTVRINGILYLLDFHRKYGMYMILKTSHLREMEGKVFEGLYDTQNRGYPIKYKLKQVYKVLCFDLKYRYRHEFETSVDMD